MTTSLSTATSTRTDQWTVQARQQAAAKATRTASVSTATSTHDAAVASYLADWTNSNIDAKTLAINARATAIATSSGAKNLANYNFGTNAPVSIGGITGSGTGTGGGDSPFAFVGYGGDEKQQQVPGRISDGTTPNRASSLSDRQIDPNESHPTTSGAQILRGVKLGLVANGWWEYPADIAVGVLAIVIHDSTRDFDPAGAGNADIAFYGSYLGNSEIPSMPFQSPYGVSPIARDYIEEQQQLLEEDMKSSNPAHSELGAAATPLIDELVITTVTTPLPLTKLGSIGARTGPVLEQLGTRVASKVELNIIRSTETGVLGRAVTGMDNRAFSSLAEQQYDAIRAVYQSDIEVVARNTGLSFAEVTTMKKHLFYGKHQRFAPELGKVVRKRFDANDEVAEAWIRAQNDPLSTRQKQWFRQLADHELAERVMMGQGMPFQDLSAWQLVNGQWEHVFREGLQGAHELAPRTPKFWPFFD